jgi:hypothetical protein
MILNIVSVIVVGLRIYDHLSSQKSGTFMHVYYDFLIYLIVCFTFALVLLCMLNMIFLIYLYACSTFAYPVDIQRTR